MVSFALKNKKLWTIRLLLPSECFELEEVDSAQNYILDMFTETYTSLLDRIPEKQREVFLAIAKEGKAKNVSSKAFVTQDNDVYIVYDPFFALWLRQRTGS